MIDTNFLRLEEARIWTSISRMRRSAVKLCSLIALMTFMPIQHGHAQVNKPGEKPFLGWSSWSQESHTFTNNSGAMAGGEAWLTEAQIKTQSDALRLTGLQWHGWEYINIDSGWALSQVNSTDSANYYDSYGRPLPDTTKFPDGMRATAEYIHRNGQKAGIYWVPGVPKAVAAANLPILNTPYHAQDILVTPNTSGNGFGSSYKIDFTKPGAQAYVTSMVDLFASWGFDFIKLDGVTPGSTISFGPPGGSGSTSCPENTCVDNRADVKAWSTAIEASGRRIWLNLSWSLDHDYASWWEMYANARRIEFDIECYMCSTTITSWSNVALRFTDLVPWESNAGPTKGWNDLDSLEVGNGTNNGNTLISGLTEDERQTMMTFWSIANAPLYLGDNLTQLDAFGLRLLTNDEVLRVDQSGHPGQQVTAGTDGNTPVWAADNGDGSYSVALFNLNASTTSAAVTWSQLGFSGSARVYDLWKHQPLGEISDSFSVTLPAHGSSLIRVSTKGRW
jgi:alpha-galactosidase